MSGNGRVIQKSTVTLDEIPLTIEVERKRIRHIYLHVRPGARVLISAPLRFTDAEIISFARTKTDWLIRQLERMKDVRERPLRQYESGEIMYVWGQPYVLTFLPDKSRSLSFREGEARLSMPGDASRDTRETFVKGQMKLRLHRAIAMRLPVWEKDMGLYARSFAVRDMKSRWGSCNIATARLTFNLELIRLDPICLDYICVHELAHLRHSRHNKAFWNLVAAHIPDWKTTRAALNRAEQDLLPI